MSPCACETLKAYTWNQFDNSFRVFKDAMLTEDVSPNKLDVLRKISLW